MRLRISLQSGDFDVAAETAALTMGQAKIGATVAFTGFCRDEQGRLSGLELEHYPDMAEAELTRIARQAEARWRLHALTVVHRFGLIRPSERIVLVLTAATHRRAAFEAAEFVMDFLKTRAPFWKREHLSDGATGAWVAAASTDADAARQWDESDP